MAEIARPSAEPWLRFRVQHNDGALRLDAEAQLTGPVAVLMGPSGAGKTSLLRAIAGLLRTARGFVTVAGTHAWDSKRGLWLRPALRGCGLVTQRPALFPALTAADNIAFGLAGISRPQQQERVREMAELFRIGALLERKPAELSGGEQQRVAVARTLAPGPRVLLLDEPFAGLDFVLKSALLDNLETWLTRTATPALYVTHDIAAAWRMGMRAGAEALRMDSGEIVEHGPALQVLARERSQVAEALAKNPSLL